jgi:hypothetical protein
MRFFGEDKTLDQCHAHAGSQKAAISSTEITRSGRRPGQL